MRLKSTVAIVLGLWAFGASSQGYNTHCTRDYFGNVSCRTAPVRNNDTSLNELRQIIETPMPAMQGINPNDTANRLRQFDLELQQNSNSGAFEVQTGSTPYIPQFRH
jgi:hypothetical protein